MTPDRDICAQGTCPRAVVAHGRCAEHADVQGRADDGDAAVMGDECACGAHGTDKGTK